METHNLGNPNTGIADASETHHTHDVLIGEAYSSPNLGKQYYCVLLPEDRDLNADAASAGCEWVVDALEIHSTRLGAVAAAIKTHGVSLELRRRTGKAEESGRGRGRSGSQRAEGTTQNRLGEEGRPRGDGDAPSGYYLPSGIVSWPWEETDAV
jgi:hypothetical protein